MAPSVCWGAGTHLAHLHCVRSRQVEDLAGTMDKVKSMLLLAKVHKSAGDMKNAVDDLIQARVFQNTVCPDVPFHFACQVERLCRLNRLVGRVP